MCDKCEHGIVEDKGEAAKNFFYFCDCEKGQRIKRETEDSGFFFRRISDKELADLPNEWEGSKVDTSRYYECFLRVYETTRETYEIIKGAGDPCMKYKGKYYVA